MNLLDLIILSIGLAMDAFAVAICKGMSLKKMEWKKGFLVGLYFGLFQLIMPLIGYYIIVIFKQNVWISNVIENFDHWIAFVLLCVIGISMVKESFSEEEINSDFSFKAMLMLAIATSIDALSVGISFAAINLSISVFIAVLIIGVITFIISTIGVLVGNVFGLKFKQPAEVVGGIVLVLIGIKILLEGLGLIV